MNRLPGLIERHGGTFINIKQTLALGVNEASRGSKGKGPSAVGSTLPR